MRNAEFVYQAELLTLLDTLYVLGAFGAPLNEKNKKRYTNNYSYNKDREAIINAASDKTFAFDCVGLIKAILGGFSADLTATYGGTIVNKESNGISYGTDHIPDYSANSMFAACTFISTDFSNIEPGEVLWLDGHIGIYIGTGLAVECTPKWKNRVQITAVGNIMKDSAYPIRNWEKHGKLPWVVYGDEPEADAFKLIDEIEKNLTDAYTKLDELRAILEGV